MSIPLSKKMYRNNSPAKTMSDIDTGLALQNMVLQAKDIGIDSCIVNLSDQHYKKEQNLNFYNKISKEIKKNLKLHSINPYSFEYFLDHFLRIPKHYKIRAGLVLGYGKVFPNIESFRHGKNVVKREITEKYILMNEYAE